MQGREERRMSEITEQEVFFANRIIDVIDHVQTPMLIYIGEKEVVKKALRMLLDEYESQRR